MKTKHFLTALISLIVLSSCKKEPEASFNVSNLTPKINESITLTSTSSDYEELSWYLSDGTFLGSQSSITTSFAFPGTYVVKLVAKNNGQTDDHQVQITVSGYNSLQINEIEVLQWPSTNNSGFAWDAFSGPDIYCTISTSTTIYHTTAYINDVTSFPKLYDVSPPYLITDINKTWYVDLNDYDSANESEYMGFVDFNFNDYSQGASIYPSVITKSNGNRTIRIYVTWQ